MKRRVLLPALAVAAVVLAVSASKARAGLFGDAPAAPAPAACEAVKACEPACEPACAPATCAPKCRKLFDCLKTCRPKRCKTSCC